MSPASLSEKSVNGDSSYDGDNSLKDVELDLPMDRGLTAWLQVLGCWILFANTWGLTNSFGIFQTYYTNTLLPDHTPSSIAWIGSVQLFLMMLVGAGAGWLLDAGYLTHVLVAGTFLTSFGTLMISLCTDYWQIFLAQALCAGMGGGLLALCSVAVIPMYFRERRMLATGVAATGSSFSGIVYPIMIRRLLVRIGFAWSIRVFGLVVLGGLIICIAILRSRPSLCRRGAVFETRHFRDTPYVLFCLSYGFMMGAVYIPFFFIQSYSIRLGIPPSTAVYLLSITNAASLLGRLLPNYLADKYGGINVMIPCSLACTLILLFFRFVHDLPGLVAVAVVYGFMSGGMVSLPPGIIASLTSDAREFGTRVGMGLSIASFGALVGNPIGGLVQRGEGERDVQRAFQGSWFFGAGFMGVAVVCMGTTRYLKVGWRVRDKC